MPGLLECFYLLAKTKFIANDDEGCQRTLEQCLKLNPTYAEAHLLFAQLYVKQEKAKLAAASLEQSLSHNFEVKDSPIYYLIKARIHEQLGENDEALRTLESVMQLPGVKSSNSQANKKKGTSSQSVSIYDRVSIYLQLAGVFVKLNQVVRSN